jgi:site-specific DNA recombinase
MTKLAVGYIRVSTQDQASEGVSLDAQETRIVAWCKSQGWDPSIFADCGLSGGRADNRPGLQQALEAVESAGSGVLVVYSLSRLARSVRDTLALAERLQKAGCDLVSLTEGIDTTTATGTMVFRLLAVLAEFERDLTAERTKGALAVKKANGESYGEVPYGYRRVGEPKRGRKDAPSPTLEPDPSQQKVIVHICSAREKGWSWQTIANDLNGHPKYEAGPKGGKWHARTVQRIYERTQEDES